MDNYTGHREEFSCDFGPRNGAENVGDIVQCCKLKKQRSIPRIEVNAEGLIEFLLRQQSLNVHEQLDNIITYQLLHPQMLLTCLNYCH
jgi:hypothetical protein